ADYTLMAIGVRANVENIGLDKIGMELDSGWIKVNGDYETNVSGVYAIGDVIGNPCLAHVASAEGVHAVEKIAGQNPPPVNYEAIPACTYCKPQVASVGLTEKKAIEKGLEIAVGKFHFRANGKSLASGEFDGFVKVIFDSKTDQLIGAHIIGSEATELIPELTLAITNKMTFDELKNSIHAHPTLSEAVKEAIHDAYGEAIHK
ncbi:MAG: dihydrolipoyl dehydrogenase, partial [Candidatus Neomarinimicrobiota bacterium]